MTEKRYKVIDNGFFVQVQDTTLTEDKHEGSIDDIYQLCSKLNELDEENVRLKSEIEELENKIEVLEGKLWNCQCGYFELL